MRIGLVVTLWSVLVTTGLGWTWSYKSTPGPRGAAPLTWPRGAPFERPAGEPALVVAVHPHCACSRATLAELARLQASLGRDVPTWVLFFRPPEMPEGWERTDLWNRALEIPGVVPVVDVDGRAAESFGARTSGHILYYDERGRLRFSGGLTSSRGHEGTSAGFLRIRRLARGQPIDGDASPIFGCSLNGGAS